MSIKRMERIRKFISSNLGDDQMDVDLDFTERYLSQFETIDRQIIDVLVDNGYQNREELLAFDISEDLPLLPVLNMAQKSLLRKVLKQLHESEEFDTKIYDIKGDDTISPPIVDIISSAGKRKMDTSPRSSSPKKLRSSSKNSDQLNDGLGPKMRRMVSGRKSIRGYESSQTESDNETEFVTSIDPKRFKFANNQIKSFGITSNNTFSRSKDEDSEEEEEVDVKPIIETRTGRGRRTQSSIPVPTPPNPAFNSMSYNSRPKLTARKSIREPTYSERTRRSIATNRVSTLVEVTPKTTPSKRNSSSTYVPTPTELEVRERLEQKKSQQKSGRKKR